MLKPAPNIFWRNLIDRSSQCSLDPTISACSATSQSSLDFGDTLFDWIKVRRMGGQFFDPCPSGTDQIDRPLTTVKTDLIQQDQIARLQIRNQKMLDVEVPDPTIYCFLDHHRGSHAGQAQRKNDRNIATSLDRLCDLRALASRRTGINTGHRAMDSKFVNKDQAPNIQAALPFLKGGPLNRVRLLRQASLFFD